MKKQAGGLQIAVTSGTLATVRGEPCASGHSGVAVKAQLRAAEELQPTIINETVSNGMISAYVGAF
jgi:hypothetical protein